RDDFEAFVSTQPQRTVKISRFIQGPSCTINACVSKQGILMSHFFYQIMRLQQCNKYEGGTSGNDYAYDYQFSSQIKDSIYQSARSMGEYMQSLGYQGIFGLDMVIDKNAEQVYVLENNARLVASIPVFTKLQLLDQEVPLLLIHLAELMGVDYQIMVDNLNASYQHQRQYSQLILRNTSDTKQIYEADYQTGIYTMLDQQLVWQRAGISAADLQTRDEALLHRAPEGREIKSNLEYANLQFKYGIISPDGTLKPQVEPWLGELLMKNHSQAQ
ncbi:MAG TPA: ATP-grasp domain-containing protein, partial [Candidatus Wirthbacteria bacterium]|nr:ATP-grasp domain-containing protein [Candidatus Wirthbacteria bacterium]